MSAADEEMEIDDSLYRLVVIMFNAFSCYYFLYTEYSCVAFHWCISLAMLLKSMQRMNMSIVQLISENHVFVLVCDDLTLQMFYDAECNMEVMKLKSARQAAWILMRSISENDTILDLQQQDVMVVAVVPTGTLIKMCSIPVRSSPPAVEHLFYTGQIPFLLSNQQCQSTEVV